jgi:hypothetical protein
LLCASSRFLLDHMCRYLYILCFFCQTCDRAYFDLIGLCDILLHRLNSYFTETHRP